MLSIFVSICHLRSFVDKSSCLIWTVHECSVAKSWLMLFDPRDYSLPGSSVYAIFQAKYWGGLPFPSPHMNSINAKITIGWKEIKAVSRCVCVCVCVCVMRKGGPRRDSLFPVICGNLFQVNWNKLWVLALGKISICSQQINGWYLKMGWP